MGKILGEGVFGVVIKADVYGIFGKNGVVIVVVKMLKGRIVKLSLYWKVVFLEKMGWNFYWMFSKWKRSFVMIWIVNEMGNISFDLNGEW